MAYNCHNSLGFVPPDYLVHYLAYISVPIYTNITSNVIADLF